MKNLYLISLFTCLSIISSAQKQQIIHVKFPNELAVSIKQGQLVVANEIYSDLDSFGYWKPFYSAAPEDLHSYWERAQQKLNKPLANPNTQFEFVVTENIAAQVIMERIQAKFKQLDYVLTPPKISEPTVPNYEPMQLYLFDQEPGIHAQEFWNFYGNHGANVKICDIEFRYNPNHIDLPEIHKVGQMNINNVYDSNHGTAVLGVLGALNNGIGVTGICYDSELYFSSCAYDNGFFIEDALIASLDSLNQGDIVLIEQHIMAFDSSSNSTWVPVEWYQPYYDAIQLLSGNGIIVVEAAGNGSISLDDSLFSTANNGHYPFLPQNRSEAIMVGAGSMGFSEIARSKLWFSNYGSRVDLQGEGEGVFTTGYGTAYDSEGENALFTYNFSGTSSASPIVTGAVALLQSLYKSYNNGTTLDANFLRTLLVQTGKPQQDGYFSSTYDHIGPLPNVYAAAQVLMGNLGLPALNETMYFNLYPNPTHGDFVINLPASFIKEIIVKDIYGKIQNMGINSTDIGIQITTTGLSSGTYFIQIVYTNGNIQSKQFQLIN